MQGVKAHPDKFWFVETPDKIPNNSGTDVSTHLFSVSLFKLTFFLKTTYEDPFFEDHISQKRSSSWLLWEKICITAQKVFGQVWANSEKNPSHSPKFSCPYTYDVSTNIMCLEWHIFYYLEHKTWHLHSKVFLPLFSFQINAPFPNVLKWPVLRGFEWKNVDACWLIAA